jgi:hypothetical protein
MIPLQFTGLVQQASNQIGITCTVFSSSPNTFHAANDSSES